MAMEICVREVATSRGIKNARELADKVGISLGTAYPLWQKTATRIDLLTMEKLCRTLNANTGMLLVYHPEKEV
jgi:DNA-binding Xre family transcriptional regulator